MRKGLLVLCAVMGLVFVGSAFALSESDYRELLKDSEFAAADGELKQAWDEAKARLTPEEFDAMKASQREWVRSVRDEAAEELMDFQGYSRAMAYTAVTNYRVKAIRALGAKKAESVSLTPGIINSDKEYITVIADGRGKDRQDALESAYTGAVRLAVGMIISGRTELNNDEISERIIMHSRGVIESFDLLGEKDDGRQTRLYIRAKVHREILQDETKRYIEAQTVKADTNQAKQRTGAELLREVLESYEPEDFFSASLNPKIQYDKQTRKPYAQITEKFNQSVFWDEFLPKLRNALDGVAVKKTKEFYDDKVRNANQIEGYSVAVPNDAASYTVYKMPFWRFSDGHSMNISEIIDADDNRLLSLLLSFAPGYHLTQDEGSDTIALGSDEGYTIELDPDELQRLDTMKFAVVFEQ